MASGIFKSHQITFGDTYSCQGSKVVHTNTDDSINLNIIEEQTLNNDFSKILEESEEIIKRAKDEAECILKVAKENANKIIEDAKISSQEELKIIERSKSHGYEEGLKNGYNDGKMEYEELTNAAKTLKEEARLSYEQTMENMEEEIIKLVISIAKKVISDDITMDKEKILYLIKKAVMSSSDTENISLKISGEDYDFVLENKERLLSMLDGVYDIDIKKELGMKKGSCIVETNYGNMDAGINTILKGIEDAFLEMIKK